MAEYLVTAEWLQAALADNNNRPVKLVEATFFLPTMNRDSLAEFEEAHLPGAVFFDIDAVSQTDNPLPHMLPTSEQFAAEISKMGIEDTDHIVIYDRSPLFSAARAWWMFRYFGHTEVSILDGGYKSWLAAGGQTQTGAQSVTASRFTARNQSEFTAVTMDEIASWIDAGTCPQILDARASDRFMGIAKEPRPGLRSGHIPGAINVPISSLLDPETGMVKSADRLKQIFDEAGVNYDAPAITSCGSGVTACGLILGLAMTGKTDISLYDGSWSEWGASDKPIAP